MYNGEDVMKEIGISAKHEVLLNINYTDSKGALSGRLVEPYEVKNGSLFAYCTEKNAMRNFKLSNINSARHSDIKFAPRWPISI